MNLVDEMLKMERFGFMGEDDGYCVSFNGSKNLKYTRCRDKRKPVGLVGETFIVKPFFMRTLCGLFVRDWQVYAFFGPRVFDLGSVDLDIKVWGYLSMVVPPLYYVKPKGVNESEVIIGIQSPKKGFGGFYTSPAEDLADFIRDPKDLADLRARYES